MSPCPRCGNVAPPVVRGTVVRCSRCGLELADRRTANAGKPAQLGGTIVRVFGWAVLVGGLLVAALLALFFQWLLPGGFAGFALGGIVGLMSVAFALILLLGGGKLRDSGAKKEQDARMRALHSLAARSSGVVTTEDAARAMGTTTDEADHVLTELVKRGDDVRLEVDDDGRLLYLFGPTATVPPTTRVRISGPTPERRVDTAAYDDAAAAEAEESARRRRTR